MILRQSLAARNLSKFAAAVVIVCFFGYSLTAVADPPPWSMTPQVMSQKEVHNFVAAVGVGANVFARISSSGSGPPQFSTVGGRIVSITDTSVALSVWTKGKTTIETYAYADIMEIHESPAGKKHALLALGIIAGGLAALLVIVLHHHPPAQPSGGPG